MYALLECLLAHLQDDHVLEDLLLSYGVEGLDDVKVLQEEQR